MNFAYIFIRRIGIAFSLRFRNYGFRMKPYLPGNLYSAFITDIQYYFAMRKINTYASQDNSGRIAIVCHLYYTENWELFYRKIRNLRTSCYDLFITVPGYNKGFIGRIQSDFPGATCIIVPNRGRDVLPFIKIARVLLKKGYRNVIKFHSKKSKHWDGGAEWLGRTMESLIPDNANLIRRIIKDMNTPRSGVAGPLLYYYPLTLNFSANGSHMTRVIKKLYGPRIERSYLQEKRVEYGFFGGTMFWINLQSISSLIEISKTRYFESEKGQIDGTYAHALERLFCIIPEIQGQRIYALTSTNIRDIPYKTTNLPEWAR